MTVFDDPWDDRNRPADEEELAAAEDRYVAQFGWTREGNVREPTDPRQDRDDLEGGEDEYDHD